MGSLINGTGGKTYHVWGDCLICTTVHSCLHPIIRVQYSLVIMYIQCSEYVNKNCNNLNMISFFWQINRQLSKLSTNILTPQAGYVFGFARLSVILSRRYLYLKHSTVISLFYRLEIMRLYFIIHSCRVYSPRKWNSPAYFFLEIH